MLITGVKNSHKHTSIHQSNHLDLHPPRFAPIAHIPPWLLLPGSLPHISKPQKSLLLFQVLPLTQANLSTVIHSLERRFLQTLYLLSEIMTLQYST